MSAEPELPEQGRPPPVPAGPFDRLIGAMNALGTVWIIGLMVLINANIIGRAGFNAPIAGVPELVSFSIVGIVFLQLAHTLASGSMTRSDIVLGLLETRAPRLRRFLLGLFHLVGAVLMAIVAWKFWPHLVAAWEFPARHFMGNPGFFTIVQWPLFGLMLAGIVATALQFLFLAIGHFRAAAGRGATAR